MSGNWLDSSGTSNRYIQTYIKGFVDMSGGNLLLRPGPNHVIVQGGDISINTGRLFVGGDVYFGGNLKLNANSLYSGGSLFTGGSGSGSSITGNTFTTDISFQANIFITGNAVSLGTTTTGNAYVSITTNANIVIGNIYTTVVSNIYTNTVITQNTSIYNNNLVISSQIPVYSNTITPPALVSNVYIGTNAGVIANIIPSSTAAATSVSWTNNSITWAAAASSNQTGYAPNTAFNTTVTGNGWLSGTTGVYNNDTTGAYNATTYTTPVSTIGTVAGEWLQIQSNTGEPMVSFQLAAPNDGTANNDALPQSFTIAGSYPTNTGLGTMWVADGSGTNALAYSNDGINWTGIAKSASTFTNAGWGIAWSGTMWVAAGSGTNSIAYSTNGTQWTGIPTSASTFTGTGLYAGQGITWSGTMWVAVGTGTNSIAYSTNGTQWTGIPTSASTFTNYGYGIAWSGTMWVAVGSGTNSIAYSTNGTQWTGIPTSASTFTSYGNGIAWSGTMWVAAGNGTNSIAYSTNGTQWTGVSGSTSLFTNYGNGIAWSGTMWVAVGFGTYSIAYSTNGTQWTGIVASASTFTIWGYGIAWSGTMWVAVGRGTNSIAYSTNGTQWTGIPTSTSTLFSGTGYTGYGIASNYLPNTWSPILTGSWNSNPYVTGDPTVGQGTATATYQIPSGTTTNATQGALTYSTYGNALNSYLSYRLIITNIAAQAYGFPSGSISGQTGGFWFPGFGALNQFIGVSNYQATYTPNIIANTITGYSTSSVTFSMDPTTLNQLDLSGSIQVTGSTLTTLSSISKSGGTFEITHPLDTSKKLIHSFIEGPRCDLIYRGTTQLQNGIATVNIDTECVASPECAMEDGTFEALTANPVCFLRNNTSFNALIGNINGNILSITCEDLTSTDSVYWMVVAERHDDFIKSWSRTNHSGYLITEYPNPDV